LRCPQGPTGLIHLLQAAQLLHTFRCRRSGVSLSEQRDACRRRPEWRTVWCLLPPLIGLLLSNVGIVPLTRQSTMWSTATCCPLLCLCYLKRRTKTHKDTTFS
jgi:hypothetical protein